MPELRFAGFAGEWEEKKLGDIGKAISGNITVNENDCIINGIPFYKVSDMNFYKNNTYMNEAKAYVSPDYIIKNGLNIIKNIPAIIFAKRGAAIKLERKRIVNHQFLLDTNMMSYSPSKILDIYFAKMYLDKKGFSNFIQTGALPAINLSDINSYKINKPNLEEQEKIGDLFSKIDQLIESQQELVDQTIAFKKSMLQKMFPQKDSLAPEFRFDGFDDNWESFKIKELANIKTGESNTQDADENGKYPFYIRSENPQSSNKYLYDEEAVLTIGDGKIGKVFFYVNGKYDLHQRVYRIFNFNENLDGKYFYHYFSKFFLRRAISLSAKATVDSVRMEMISDMIIKVPSLEEQIKIRDFLDNLNKKIAREEKLLDAYKDMKKSLLQKMFV